MQPREHLIETNGIHMNVIEGGAGSALVFIHGLGWDAGLWVEAFRRYGDRHRVIAGDTRGHGKSSRPAGPYSIRQFADDWRGALDAQGVVEACLIGFSQGGMIAMQLALDEPERFSGLVLSCTLCRVTSPPPGSGTDRITELRAAGPEAAARSAANLIFSPAYREQHPEKMKAFLAKRAAFPMDALAAAMGAGSGFDIRDRLTTYRKPCAVIAGELDALTKADDVRLVAESVPGARFVTVAGAGHMVPVEQPAAFYQIVDEFIADQTKHAEPVR